MTVEVPVKVTHVTFSEGSAVTTLVFDDYENTGIGGHLTIESEDGLELYPGDQYLLELGPYYQEVEEPTPVTEIFAFESDVDQCAIEEDRQLREHALEIAERNGNLNAAGAIYAFLSGDKNTVRS